MKNRFRITTAKLILAVAALVPAFAHGGFDHIRGTVARVANNVLTVKTAHGNVDVKLDSNTNLTRNDRKALVSDLKPGARDSGDSDPHRKYGRHGGSLLETLWWPSTRSAGGKEELPIRPEFHHDRAAHGPRAW